jgi:hypothetical protein
MATDEAPMRRYAERLADAIDAALPGWVEGCVRRRLASLPADVATSAAAAGEQARRDVGGAVRELVLADIDAQWTNPLALLRAAVRYPTEVLVAAGAPAVERDDFALERFPDDHYDLTPATWSDFGEAVAEAGIAWGAAKAFVHRERHGR